MDIGKILDLSIKAAETDKTTENKFYDLNGHNYFNYIDNELWKIFLDEMREKYPLAYREYGEGAGDELGIKKIGRFPPKMASYGSSSRMIYLLSRDIENFCFEKKLPTTVGGIAHMDGYLHSNGVHYYIEAKCREPYSPKSYVIDRKYENLYRYLDEDTSLDFKCHISIIDQDKMKVGFVANGTELTRFDIKQMISHLLGVATDKLCNPTNERTEFRYLLYNPKLIKISNDTAKEKILSIYETEVYECGKIPFNDLYKVITTYLFEERNIGTVTPTEMNQIGRNFNFILCDQASYISNLS